MAACGWAMVPWCGCRTASRRNVAPQAWEIGAGRAHAKYVCPDSYVNLCAVAPGELFLVWRLREGWVAALAERKREIWPGHRLIIRLYDVSFIQFNGFNAHRVRDLTIDKLAGERLQALALAGSTQIAEIGYLLRTGEFVPAARSQAVAFPSASVSANHDAAALYVDDLSGARTGCEPLGRGRAFCASAVSLACGPAYA